MTAPSVAKPAAHKFISKYFKMKKDGTANIDDFESNLLHFKKEKYMSVWKMDISNANYDRRGWYHDVAATLFDLRKQYRYIGWARGYIYGRATIFFYGRKGK